MIGTATFRNCRSLERITIPSSATFIGERAFLDCTRLSEVTLCEGIHCIEPDAFGGRTALEQMNIPPVALVVDFEEGPRCQLLRATMPTGARGRKLIVSKWLQYRSPRQLAQAEAKVNEILGRRRQTEGQKVTLIREWFAYFDRLDVTTMLELAIWRVNLDGNERDVQARQASRQHCGGDMTVIIPAVLPFLEG